MAGPFASQVTQAVDTSGRQTEVQQKQEFDFADRQAIDTAGKIPGLANQLTATNETNRIRSNLGAMEQAARALNLGQTEAEAFGNHASSPQVEKARQEFRLLKNAITQGRISSDRHLRVRGESFLRSAIDANPAFTDEIRRAAQEETGIDFFGLSLKEEVAKKESSQLSQFQKDLMKRLEREAFEQGVDVDDPSQQEALHDAVRRKMSLASRSEVLKNKRELGLSGEGALDEEFDVMAESLIMEGFAAMNAAVVAGNREGDPTKFTEQALSNYARTARSQLSKLGRTIYKDSAIFKAKMDAFSADLDNLDAFAKTGAAEKVLKDRKLFGEIMQSAALQKAMPAVGLSGGRLSPELAAAGLKYLGAIKSGRGETAENIVTANPALKVFFGENIDVERVIQALGNAQVSLFDGVPADNAVSQGLYNAAAAGVMKDTTVPPKDKGKIAGTLLDGALVDAEGNDISGNTLQQFARPEYSHTVLTNSEVQKHVNAMAQTQYNNAAGILASLPPAAKSQLSVKSVSVNFGKGEIQVLQFGLPRNKLGAGGARIGQITGGGLTQEAREALGGVDQQRLNNGLKQLNSVLALSARYGERVINLRGVGGDQQDLVSFIEEKMNPSEPEKNTIEISEGAADPS